jgi:hypothetical protein
VCAFRAVKTSRAAPSTCAKRRVESSAVLLAAWLVVSTWHSPDFALAQENPCDPQLKQSTGDPDGYRVRGDRCEGIYVREVSDSGTLQVASFTAAFDDYDPASGRDLVLRWAAFGDGGVRLRAYSLRPKQYYRMDTKRPPGATTYAWPSNLLSRYDLRRSELGVVAWTSYRAGSEQLEVYLPVRISQLVGGGSSGYELVVLPDVELQEVFVTLARLGEDGQPRDYLKKDEALGYGYYPAERKVAIKIPPLPAPGIYNMTIGATRQHGGSSTAILWFHHAG